MKTYFSKALSVLFALVAIATALPSVADVSGPFTVNFSSLATGSGSGNPVYTPFSFPKFDSSLGSLQSVTLTFSFSGDVIGSANGVTQNAFGLPASVTHHVFFNFVDLTNNIFIAEPVIDLTSPVPPGASNATIPFGPQPGSTTLSFSVGSGDFRYDLWKNGPGDITGRLGVLFTNTSFAPDLVFYPGSDAGVYQGSFSVAYNYGPNVAINVAINVIPHSINLRSQSAVPVAILGSPSFDVGNVALDTVMFAGASPVKSHFQNVNGDRLTDVVLFFRTQDMQFDANPFARGPTTTTATLTGKLKDGTAFTGTDSVQIVP